MQDTESIKQNLDCRNIFASEFPDLFRSAGNSFNPWGDGESPSMSLHRNYVYGFNDGRKRDCFDLIQRSRGVDFRSAVRIGAELANTRPPDSEPGSIQRAERTTKKPRQIVAEYDYTDESGTLLYQTARLDPKDFRQRRPDQNGGWIWSLKGVRLVLYRLPEIIRNDTVWIVEGEKDADTLQDLGFCGTTTPLGAGKWPKLCREHGIHEPLHGKTVIILPDNDKPGKEHANTVAESLVRVAGSVKVIELSGLGPKQDVTDFIKKHGAEDGRRLLLDLTDSTPEYTPQEASPQTSPSTENCTDMGNARRLAARFGDRIRYCNQFGWLIYDGTRWIPDGTSQIQAFAKATVREIYEEAARAIDEDTRKRLASWALSCETAHRVQAMITLLPSEPGISVSHDLFDSDKMALNLANGTLDLRTGKLRPHNKDDLLTKLVPVSFDPTAECPRWDQFILEIMNDDTELASFLQRLLGYGITGETREQAWCFFWGKGANGKSTLLETLSYVLGDYAMNTPAETFLESSSGSIRNDLARLRGARIVTASEPRVGRFDHATLKSFCGEDRLSVRFLHKEYFEYQPEALLCFSANHRPNVKDTSPGFWRRLLLVPFVRQFNKKHRDPKLRDALRAEASGILNWLVAGCLEWQRSGLNPPDTVREAVNEYRSETDVLGDFIETCCVVANGTQVPKQALYQAYQRFCEERGIYKPLSQRSFNESILAREGVYQERIGTSRVRIWRGIGLRAPEAAHEECASVKRRSCADCDFEQCCPTEESRRDADRCKNYKPCG